MEEDIVKLHIQELKHKSHVEGIEQNGDFEYKIMYSPQLGNSPYSHLCFRLQINIPEQYPQQPPQVVFLDKIYHLNIDPVSGQVHMGILFNDWSPYLTLSAVIDSLDSIMEEPDLQYAATAALQDEYIYEPDSYMKKIQQTIKAYSSVVMMDHSQDMSEHIKRIKESSVVSNNHQAQFQSVEIDQVNSVDYAQKIQEEDFSEAFNMRKTQGNFKKESPKIRIETLSDIPYQAPEVSLAQSKFTKKSGSEIPSIQIDLFNQTKSQQLIQRKTNMKKKQEPRPYFGTTDGKQISLNSEFENIQASLKRADRMNELLMSEWETMEETIKRTQSVRLRQKLGQKQQRILQMIDETLELSSSLREKMFSQLKNSTKPLLK